MSQTAQQHHRNTDTLHPTEHRTPGDAMASGGAPAPPRVPPPTVRIASWSWIATAAVNTVEAILLAAYTVTLGGMPEHGTIRDQEVGISIIVGATLLIAGFSIWLSRRMRAGRNWARVTVTVLGGLGVALDVLVLLSALAHDQGVDVVGDGPYALTLVLMVTALVLQFTPRANEYFGRRIR